MNNHTDTELVFAARQLFFYRRWLLLKLELTGIGSPINGDFPKKKCPHPPTIMDTGKGL